VRFQLLGPLSLSEGTAVAVLQPSKPAILLAALLVQPNTVVSADWLLRAVWGEQQPGNAKAALQTCVLRLRRIFAKHGIANNVIEAVPGGYRITATADTLDLLRFRDVVRSASRQSDPEAELYALREALLLWHGPLLANIPSELLHRDVVPRLTEERIGVHERVCDIELALGRCRQVLVDLWGLARTHPGHERFSEQLIESLYRTGRQSEALAEYRRVKGYLRGELGVDPGPGLQRLELAILRGEDLGTATVPRALPTVKVEQRISRDEETAPMPAPLCFTGRESETETISNRLRGKHTGPHVVVLSGAPGVGKTALALHVAHRVRDSFPDGFRTVLMTRRDGTAKSTDEVRSELFGAASPFGGPARRTLLVLDDVVGAEQVRPLLPTGPGSAVIVTSRRGLAGLVATHGGWVRRLEQLDEAGSHRLLVSLLGSERVHAEQDAARRLARACGHLPIALRITAARLLTRPRMRIAECVHWLGEDPVSRLSVADDSELSMTRILDAALARVDRRLADAFVAIADSSQPAHRLSVGGCATVLGATASGTQEILDQLVDTGLLDESAHGDYRMHPLFQSFGRSVSRLHPSAAPC